MVRAAPGVGGRWIAEIRGRREKQQKEDVSMQGEEESQRRNGLGHDTLHCQEEMKVGPRPIM